MSRPMENAYQFIKEKILDGSYKPSQKLTENELSEVIGVSRNTIKKALLKLEQENLVEIEKNKGAFIKAYTLEEMMNYLEIREVLEGLVARTATKNIRDVELNKLEEILEQMDVSLKQNQFDEYSNLNKEFHRIMYQASKNQQAVKILNVIRTQLSRYHFRTILIPGRNQSSFQEHKKIFEALKTYDEELAQEAVMDHIANVRTTIKENFSLLL
ncbi:GntR family transcriptional regulator [Priestia filamentosa]|uniref:Transcriptional regulator n=2 Tax=Priestia filamentosa TaxID=1402861 RepID=A0A1X7E154_9BACI|nr:GntR family transcriptional regulator [Priestia filamentosa]AKO92233.1 transcriptional regulator [Priestia filamentosa]MDT3762259.1 GntR family transcriptional regulator [Priestia filamentosa]OXS68829.1 GntR family transcriptional regulator [Priestia filamentosa]RJS64469.1 GntR family transcriptional regulator [Priestia filamentosa]WCM17339.1 GntR family transcriptional regulator [Priestia filamentosa]